MLLGIFFVQDNQSRSTIFQTQYFLEIVAGNVTLQGLKRECLWSNSVIQAGCM